ncbi:MAG: peptidoglycan recognition family protein [Actinomycetota bacterium]
MLEQLLADGTRVTYLDRTDVGLGAVPVRGHVVPTSRFVGIVAHHTVSVVQDWDRDGITHGDLDDIGRFMRNLTRVRAADLGPEVPYSFVVFRTDDPNHAVVAEGRGLGRTGAHTEGFNSTRYGVAYAGNTIHDPVTPGVASAYRWVGSLLDDPIGARPTIGHRDTKATACPGTQLYAELGRLQPPFTLYLEDEMTPEEKRMLIDIHETLVGWVERGPHERSGVAVHDLATPILSMNGKVDALLAGQADLIAEIVQRVLQAIPNGEGGGASDAQIRAIVRQELDKTRVNVSGRLAT